MNKLGIGLLFAGLFAFSFSFVFQGCSSDPCEDVTCTKGTPTETKSGDDCFCPCDSVSCDHGTATATDEGTDCYCECDAGYEGKNCETVSRKKFLATYDVSDDCASSDYTSEIKKSSTIDQVLITNFGKFLCNGGAPTVIAKVDTTDLTIPKQYFCNEQFWIKGSGTLSDNQKKVTVEYETDTTGSGIECTAVLTKK